MSVRRAAVVGGLVAALSLIVALGAAAYALTL